MHRCRIAVGAVGMRMHALSRSQRTPRLHRHRVCLCTAAEGCCGCSGPAHELTKPNQCTQGKGLELTPPLLTFLPFRPCRPGPQNSMSLTKKKKRGNNLNKQNGGDGPIAAVGHTAQAVVVPGLDRARPMITRCTIMVAAVMRLCPCCSRTALFFWLGSKLAP